MLRRLRANHPFVYCILAEVLFLAVLQVGQLVLVGVLLLLLRAGVIDSAAIAGIDDYAIEFLMEMIAALVPVVLLQRTGRLHLLTRRGCGFLNGLLVGMWPFVLIAYSLAGDLLFTPEDAQARTPVQIGFFFAAMFSVGVAEEFLSRGVIAETLLEHFGTDRAGVWKASLLSGLIFGAGHLINMLASEPFGVLMQCIFAAVLGTLFAAIYFRTGNLWVTVFLHALMDTASLWQGGIYGTQTTVETINSYDITMLYSVLIYGIPVLYLLRKSKIGEVKFYFGREKAKKLPPQGHPENES